MFGRAENVLRSVRVVVVVGFPVKAELHGFAVVCGNGWWRGADVGGEFVACGEELSLCGVGEDDGSVGCHEDGVSGVKLNIVAFEVL